MTKLRDLSWKERDRTSQLASALYPHLSDDTTKKQMLDRAAEDGGQGRVGLEKRITQGQRDYGIKAQPEASKFDGVPGLKRVTTPTSAKQPWWK
jgi:hypothetical protein